MRVKNLDLIGAILIVVIDVLWIQLPGRPLLIGIILALPLTFVLPGYVVAQTFFRNKSPGTPDSLVLQPRLKLVRPASAAEYIVISLGLSMAIDVMLGFLLNIFPIGLQAQSWTLSLGLITTVFALLAAYLRRKDHVTIAGMKNKRKPGPRVTLYECILFGLALLVAASAVWLSVIRPPAIQASFTQFWMLPSDQATNSCAVRIGIHNQETTTMEYRVVVTVNGNPVNSWASVTLAPQKEWDQVVSFPPGTAGNIYVQGQLYQSTRPGNVYREVHLVLHSSKKSQGEQCTT